MVVFKSRNGKPSIYHAYVSVIYVLQHDIEAIEARAQRYGLLINRRDSLSLLQQSRRNITFDRVLKGLHNSAAECADAPEQIHSGGVPSLFFLKTQLPRRYLHGNRNQNRLRCDAQEI